MSTLDIIKNREKQFKGLYDRMDADAKKVQLARYQMMRLDDPKTKIDDVVNVTMNYPATFADDIATLIMNAMMQTVVEGYKNNRGLNGKEQKTIETFLDVHYDLVDDLLARRNLRSLMTWLSRHISIRGWVGARYWTWLEGGKNYTPDLMPWDMRYVAYEYGTNGLKWASYRTWRSKNDILEEYPEAKISGSNESDIEVVTFLDDEKQEVYVEDNLAETKKHIYGHVPVVIQACPAGFMLRDKGYLEHEGESIFMLDRGLYDELNRAVSIEQTMAMKSILAPYAHEVQDPGGQPQPYPDVVGQNTPVLAGEMPKIVEQADLNTGAQMGRADILSALQQGGRNVDLGNINQPFSAVAIAAISELRKKVLIPRFEGISQFKQQLSTMMLSQFKTLAERYYFKGEIGLPGRKRSFDVRDLDGDYSIRYRFMSKTKQEEIANIAIAQSARGMFPMKIIVKDILLAQNPDEILAGLESEKAELADPIIGLFRLAHSLVDEADTLSEEDKDAKLIESMRLTEKAVIMIRAERMAQMPGTGTKPEQPQPLPQPKTNMSALIPLLGQAGRSNGGRQPQPQGVGR